MTGIDYRRALALIKQEQNSLTAHVDSRLRELIEKYPEAVVVDKGHGQQMFCKQITARWFDGMSTECRISYITNIEKWSEAQHPVVQAKINL
jgi:hypothetical protein